MPVELERKLKRQAKKKGFGKKRTGAYVYGTLRNTGWNPNHNADGPSGEIDYSPSIVIEHKD
jgi:hypothetical protein